MMVNSTGATTPGPAMVARVRKVLQQEFRVLRETLETYSTLPRAGSVYWTEKAAWKSADHHQRAHRRRLHLGALLQSRLIVINMLDHVKGSGLLLGEDEWIPISSHMSLSRVTCEAAGRIGYLMDPDVSYETRIVRAAILGLFSEEANLTTLRDLIPTYPDLTPALAEAERSRNKIQDTITRAGITFRRNPRGKATHMELATISEPMKVEAIALMAKHFGHRPAWYRLTSGITHSSAWMLDDTVVSSPTDPMLAVDPDFYGIGAAGLLAIDASAVVAQTYARYYGHDPDPFARGSATRTKAIDLAMNDFAASQKVI